MSCDEIVRLRDNQSLWERSIKPAAAHTLGWSVRALELVVIDENNKQLAFVENVTLRFEGQIGYTFGTLVRAEDVSPQMNIRKAEAARFFIRWVASKPMNYTAQNSRCTDELERTPKFWDKEAFGIKLREPVDLDNNYTLFAYDQRKNILFSVDFLVRPKPSKADQNALENARVLNVAYTSFMFLEKCAELGASGQPLHQLQESLAQIEKAALSLKIDTASARRKAEDNSKSELEMWDMFAAMRGTMNYEQRSSIRQFCGLQGATFLAASKHFLELQRSASR